MSHKMNTILILDVVVKLFDNSHRRMTMLTSYDPQIKPKAIGSDLLSFFLQEYNTEEYKGVNVYEKVLGKNFTNYITNKVNELLIANGYQGKYTQLTVLAIKELDKISDMVISDTEFKVPSASDTVAPTEEKETTTSN